MDSKGMDSEQSEWAQMGRPMWRTPWGLFHMQGACSPELSAGSSFPRANLQSCWPLGSCGVIVGLCILCVLCILWSGVFPAISVNKEVTAIVILGLQISEPRRHPKRETVPLIQQLPAAATPYGDQGTKDVIKSRSRMLAPDRWGAYERNDFSQTRWLHLPIHRKEP